MQILAFIGSLITAIQVTSILASGSSICLNQGCEVVDRFTVLSPLYLNLLGLAYFQAVFWSVRIFKNKPLKGFDWTGLLLLAGLAVEGVLSAYQIFVAEVICSYCLLTFAVVLILNSMHGRKQFISGAAIIMAIFISFSLLTFIPTQVFSQYSSLKSGSYGVKSCSSPAKEVYLIFASDCPHCENVIKELDGCNSCDLYLNPIDKIGKLKFSGIELNPDYSPTINRLMLTTLGIKEIPVLVVKNSTGFSFLKGEEKILNFVRRSCFNQDTVLYLDPSLNPEQEEITVITEDGGECSLDIDCNDQ
jgi:uncharacterized membrane protein